jgi:hypothetical protein
MPLEDLDWYSQGKLQCEFLLDALVCIRQGYEQLESRGEMSDRFCVRRAL